MSSWAPLTPNTPAGAALPRAALRVPRARCWVEWLLVLLLALDLAGSPLHAHRHDGLGSAGTPSATAQLAHAGFDMHVEESDGTSFSHAIYALRGASIKNCQRLAGVDAAPGSPPATPKPVASRGESWQPAPPGATAVAYRSLPPESRAPPVNG